MKLRGLREAKKGPKGGPEAPNGTYRQRGCCASALGWLVAIGSGPGVLWLWHSSGFTCAFAVQWPTQQITCVLRHANEGSEPLNRQGGLWQGRSTL